MNDGPESDYSSKNNYNYKKEVNLKFEEAVDKVKENLKEESFGVLTEIDVKAALKSKLNVDFDKYVILGACNPSFAYKALQAERDIGLMMPCNVIVYEQEGKVVVSAIMPTVAMDMIDNAQLELIAGQVEEKLKKVVDMM